MGRERRVLSFVESKRQLCGSSEVMAVMDFKWVVVYFHV